MKITINVDDTLVEKMHKKFCDRQECVSCPAQTDPYDYVEGDNCFCKYKANIFESEFNEIIEKVMDLI